MDKAIGERSGPAKMAYKYWVGQLCAFKACISPEEMSVYAGPSHIKAGLNGNEPIRRQGDLSCEAVDECLQALEDKYGPNHPKAVIQLVLYTMTISVSKYNTYKLSEYPELQDKETFTLCERRWNQPVRYFSRIKKSYKDCLYSYLPKSTSFSFC